VQGLRADIEHLRAVVRTARLLSAAGHIISRVDPPYATNPTPELARWFGGASFDAEGLDRTLLDPAVDRLYILATLLAFTVRGILPWAFTVALLAREAVLLVALALLRRYGYGPPPVHYLGKTATFILLLAFPVLLLAHVSAASAPVAGPIGWALAWWGIVLYWLAGVLYWVQTVGVVRAARARRAPA